MKFLMDKLCKTHNAYQECVTKANRQFENFDLACVLCCASYDGMSQDEIQIKKFMMKIKEGKAKYTTQKDWKDLVQMILVKQLEFP